MQLPNRITPAGSPDQYKTYSVASPLETHFREIPCEEVEEGCGAHLNGWKTTLDSETTHGSAALQYLAKDSRRYHAEIYGSTVVLTYPAGQQCFTTHRVALERPAFYIVRGGDWRGNPLGTAPVARSADDWVDDFANHQSAVHDAVERG